MKYFLGTTFFTSLIFRKAPGTVSSLFVFVPLLFFEIPSLWKLVIAFSLLFTHFICFDYFHTRFKDEDPAVYTIDEALSMVLLNIQFSTQRAWIFAFVFFRFFDILKPLGIKRVETWGVLSPAIRNIADDLLAALYAGIVVSIFEYALG